MRLENKFVRLSLLMLCSYRVNADIRYVANFDTAVTRENLGQVLEKESP